MASTRKRSLWDTKIVGRALRDAVAKLNPRTMMKNPVMFVVEIGSLITTIYTVADVVRGHHALRFDLQITLWLWFTVLFANFAEALAEGRGKAQADALRKAKSDTVAIRLRLDGTTEEVPSLDLRAGDVCLIVAGRSFLETARSWRGWRRWTSRRSPANLLQSFGRRVEIDPQ